MILVIVAMYGLVVYVALHGFHLALRLHPRTSIACPWCAPTDTACTECKGTHVVDLRPRTKPKAVR